VNSADVRSRLSLPLWPRTVAEPPTRKKTGIFTFSSTNSMSLPMFWIAMPIFAP
jgi:hypothetical protein